MNGSKKLDPNLIVINHLLYNMDAFVEKRLAICKNCAIAKIDREFGLICDSRRYLNPETNESSWFKKDGWIKGCGCFINHKVKNQNNHCPAKLW